MRHFFLIATGVAALSLFGCAPQKTKIVVEIAQSPTKVYSYLTESEKMKQWIGGLKKITPLTRTGLNVGAKAEMLLELPDGKYNITSEVLAFEPDRMIAIKAFMPDGFDETIVYRLEPVGSSTRLTFEGETELKNWIAQIMAPLWWPDAEKKLQADLERLKRLAETGA